MVGQGVHVWDAEGNDSNLRYVSRLGKSVVDWLNCKRLRNDSDKGALSSVKERE